jgi:hypothetical protein
MQEKQRGIVSQIKDSFASVTQTEDEISQDNTELSSRTGQQATASMEPLTATAKSDTVGVQQTADSSRKTV